jgi:hypothetical protein
LGWVGWGVGSAVRYGVILILRGVGGPPPPDAGYAKAIEVAKAKGLQLPMLGA